MNIFVLNEDPDLAAKDHCDRHIVKMALESAQLLSTAHRVVSGSALPKSLDASLYRATHVNHPCSIWVRESRGNYDWALNLFRAQLKEYTFRYKKIHGCERLVDFLVDAPAGLTGERTPFALAMPDELKTVDAVESYRRYYRRDKAEIAKWKFRPIPQWFVEVV